MENFKAYVEPPILVGGFNPADTESPRNKFVERFGMAWTRIPKRHDVFVLFDRKHDRVCFTYKFSIDEIAIYPGVTRKEFIESWTGSGNLIAANAVYQPVDARFKYHYLQMLEMMAACAVE